MLRSRAAVNGYFGRPVQRERFTLPKVVLGEENSCGLCKKCRMMNRAFAASDDARVMGRMTLKI